MTCHNPIPLPVKLHHYPKVLAHEQGMPLSFWYRHVNQFAAKIHGIERQLALTERRGDRLRLQFRGLFFAFHHVHIMADTFTHVNSTVVTFGGYWER